MSDVAVKTADKAPDKTKDALNRLTVAAQRELETIAAAFRERGAERFARISALGLIALILCYAGVYSPAQKKLASLDKRIATAKATARYSDRYKDAKQRLDRLRALLPPPSQADTWALDKVRETLNGRGMAPENINPPDSRPAAGFVDQTIRFSMTAKFPDLVAWLNDLESGGGPIHVTGLDIVKQSGDIGVNRIDCTVETLLPAGSVQ